MRNLFLIGMLLVGASMAGWFKINRQGERTTIEINPEEIRSDTRQAIDRGRDFLEHRERQQAGQPYGQPVQPTWPQEQIADQQPWNPGQQQSYQWPSSVDRDGYWQNPPLQDPRSQDPPVNGYPQPYYPPSSYYPPVNR
jgi:hypothetical protein